MELKRRNIERLPLIKESRGLRVAIVSREMVLGLGADPVAGAPSHFRLVVDQKHGGAQACTLIFADAILKIVGSI
jgi:hypothetical protein